MNIIEEMREIVHELFTGDSNPNDDAYRRIDAAIDRLERSGALVPVPDGDACVVDSLPVGIRIAIPGRTSVYRRVGSGASANPEPHSFVILEDCNSGDEINVPYGTHGYPVRLVPIAEAGI